MVRTAPVSARLTIVTALPLCCGRIVTAGQNRGAVRIGGQKRLEAQLRYRDIQCGNERRDRRDQPYVAVEGAQVQRHREAQRFERLAPWRRHTLALEFLDQAAALRSESPTGLA